MTLTSSFAFVLAAETLSRVRDVWFVLDGAGLLRITPVEFSFLRRNEPARTEKHKFVSKIRLF